MRQRPGAETAAAGSAPLEGARVGLAVALSARCPRIGSGGSHRWRETPKVRHRLAIVYF